MYKLILPKEVSMILDKLNSAGYKGYVVGGCVRDSLLGLEPKDWDITTSARPSEIKELFKGYKQILIGEEYGTVSVVVNGEPYEITTFREDGVYTDGRRPDNVNYSTNVIDDLSRRDFTINAIAYNEIDGIVDPFKGIEDIENGIIRCVGDAKVRFTEDLLRVLRCARFACKYDFKIEKDTLEQMLGSVEKVREKCSTERVFSGFSQIIRYCETRHRYFVDKIVIGVVPFTKQMVGFYQYNPNHVSDLFEHTMNSVCAVNSDVEDVCQIKLAMLMHDFGKVETFTIGNDGVGHFYGHSVNSERLARETLTAFNCNKKDKEFICKMVLYHDTKFGKTDKSIKRLAVKLGSYDLLRSLLVVKIADDLAKKESSTVDRLDNLYEIQSRIGEIEIESKCLSVKDLTISGEDVMGVLHIKPGKVIGETLSMLLGLVVDGEIKNNREELLKYLKNT